MTKYLDSGKSVVKLILGVWSSLEVQVGGSGNFSVIWAMFDSFIPNSSFSKALGKSNVRLWRRGKSVIMRNPGLGMIDGNVERGNSVLCSLVIVSILAGAGPELPLWSRASSRISFGLSSMPWRISSSANILMLWLFEVLEELLSAAIRSSSVGFVIRARLCISVKVPTTYVLDGLLGSEAAFIERDSREVMNLGIFLSDGARQSHLNIVRHH
jgi:hypothetical protein